MDVSITNEHEFMNEKGHLLQQIFDWFQDFNLYDHDWRYEKDMTFLCLNGGNSII